MCLLRIPDDLEHAVLDDPLNNFIGGELVVAEGDVPHKLVQVFDTLDALLQELRLKALLDELELLVSVLLATRLFLVLLILVCLNDGQLFDHSLIGSRDFFDVRL